MSRLNLAKIAQPSAPAANETELWYDSTLQRLRSINEKGIVSDLNESGWKDKNVVINGDFGIAQRQVFTTLTSYAASTARLYGPDRWGLSAQTSSLQFAAVLCDTPVTGISARYYGQFKQITGAGKMIVGQWIPANDMVHLRGSYVRIQFKSRYLTTQRNLRFGLLALGSAGTVDTIPATFIAAAGANGVDPTWGANIAAQAPLANSDDNVTLAGNGATAALTSSFARYSAVFLVPADCKNIALQFWSDVQLAINDEIHLTEVGLYQGMEIRDWVPRAEAHELMISQRYYFKTFPIAVAPAQNAGLAGALKWMAGKVGALAQGATGAIRWPGRMRITPATLTTYNPSVANAFVRDVTAAVDTTANAFVDSSDVGTSVSCTGNASTAVGNVLAVHITADAEI
jgi:hypothetical protein